MSGKRGDLVSRTVSAAAGAAAGFGARKVISFAWKKITGKEPPEHPEDPQVALGEAVAWALLVGAVGGTARLLATRATSRRQQDPDAEPAEATADKQGR
jgi:Protein of unknown function (DUF4235)